MASTHLRLGLARLGPPARAGLVAAVLVACWVAVRSAVVHGLGGFVVAGSKFTGTGLPHGVRVTAGNGYDGQFIYRLALDPFTRVVTAHGITFDDAPYRQQRIMTALLAHLVAGVPGVSTATALVLVNCAAVVVAVVAAAALVTDAGRSIWWTPVLAIPACIPISVARDLTEPVAWAGMIVALLMARRGRWLSAALALTVAVLARETSLVLVGGYLLESAYLLVRRRRFEPARLWLAIPLAVEIGWQAWVAHVWGGGLPIITGSGNNTSGVPLLGVWRTFFDGLLAGPPAHLDVGLSYLAERIALLLLIGTAGWLLARRRSAVGLGEGAAWLVSAWVALTLKSWGYDIQFLRAANEAWGFSVLVLLMARNKWADRWLVLAGLATGGVALLHALVL